MRALVVYESMFGNTREIANRVAAGLDPAFDVTVAHVSELTPEMADMAELLIVGGPTHVHGMTSARTRDAAKKMAEKEGSGFELEPGAVGSGLRE
jgi:flavodoxin